MLFSTSCSFFTKKEEDTTEGDSTESPDAVELFADPTNLAVDGASFYELVSELSPVAAWCFDESSETDAKVKNDVSDKLDNVVKAKIEDGHYGKGIRTYSNEKSYLDLGKGTLGSLINGKEAVTVSMWVLPYLNSNETYRLFTLNISGTTAGIQADYRNGSVIVSARSSVQGNLVKKTFEYNLDDGVVKTLSKYTNEGRWQHLTFTVNFKENNISLYVNGKLAYNMEKITFDSKTFQFGTPTLSDTIGGSQTEKICSFNGIIDSVMMFDRALSSDEVTKIYGERSNATSPVVDQKVVEELLKRVGKNVLFYEGGTELIYNGMYEKLSADNYKLTTVVQSGKVYIPAAAARHFDTTDGVASITVGGTSYLDLEALCDANGKTLLTVGKLSMAMDADTRFDKTVHAGALDRLARLFEEHTVTTISAAETRAVVSESKSVYTYGELSATIGYCSCPSIAKLGSSVFVSMDAGGSRVIVFESTDGGNTFAFRAIIPEFHFGTIFELDGALYILGAYTGSEEEDEVGITKSTDHGKTWSPVTHFKGAEILDAHTTSNTVLIANGRIYKAFNGRGGDVFQNGCTAYMVSAPVGADLLDANSWTLSNAVTFKTSMFTSHANGSTNTASAYAEEGNAVVGPDGKIYAIYGVKAVPAYAYAAVFECSADGKTMTFNASSNGSIIKFPGGNSKFNILYDEKSGKYLSLVTRNEDDRYWFQRNVLSLAVSDDLVNWEVVGDVLTDNTVMNDYIGATKHGFQYVDFIFDGNDILFSVREAMGESHCFHNANYLTVYRIKNYAAYITE